MARLSQFRLFGSVGVLALSVSGCDALLGDGGEGTSSGSGNSGDGDSPGAQLTEEQDPHQIGCDIQALMAKEENSCTLGGCHGARPEAGLDLLSPGVEERLVGVPSTGEDCDSEPLVNSEDPTESLLLRKIDADRFGDGSSTCGGIMPLHSEGVSEDDLECFEKWVVAIAEATEPDVGVSYKDEWVNASAESALAKVKALTNGGIVSAAELSQVREDRDALRGLVSEWVETPAFEGKLLELLRLALQQDVIGELTDQADSLNFPSRHRTPLYQNVAESFARTAQKIVLEGRPFTEIATTTSWELTTALMVLLAYTEMGDDDKRAITHWIYQNDPPEGAPATNTLRQAINTRFWYRDDFSADCETRSIRSDALFDFLFGRVGCGVGQAYLPEVPIVSGSDFNDWRTIELKETDDPSVVPVFWDVLTFRAASELNVTLPRVGFMTTPAFLANWATNEDNQFRVAASQTMITALGREFSAGDLTEPMTLSGLAEEHAEPGTSCYGCHTLLDPMRNYFSQGFDIDYQRPAESLDAHAGFAFRGESSEGGDLYDFAAQVASHPLFAAAWVQKLCYYANSQACDESDPEFERIRSAFVSSGFDFKALIVELFSSPLVTGSSYTETYDSRQWLISITRQNHLCRLLDEHLGYDDVCGEGSSFIGLIPQDEFSRGQAAPVQTAVTGSFHFAAVDSLCTRLGVRLVGDQEGRPFGLQDEAASLELMVHALMGLPEGHSRREEWISTLSAHYEAAREAGAGRTQAMRSSFTLACTSPEVMALGL